MRAPADGVGGCGAVEVTHLASGVAVDDFAVVGD